jgi:hypothetical protein
MNFVAPLLILGPNFGQVQLVIQQGSPGLTNVIEDFIILGLFVSAGFVAL